MRLHSLRHKLALTFALAVLGALVLFGAAVTAALVLDARADRARPPARSQEEEDAEDLRWALGAMAIATPVAVVGAALLGLWLARRALAPMREASARAASARGAELDLALPVTGSGDEWDALARVVNALLADARSGMDRVRHFTSDAAHELRTPLTTVRGEAELALRHPRSPEEYVRTLRVVLEESARMETLIEGLLVLARADSRLLVTGGEFTPVAQLLEDALEQVKTELRAAAKVLTLVPVAEPLRVAGSPVLLTRALANLVSNAIRHGGAHLQLGVRSVGDLCEIWVDDDGPGVPEAFVPRLFERFSRADESRGARGLGLGLALTRAIAEAHGGAVRYEPARPGSRFVLSLPMTPR